MLRAARIKRDTGINHIMNRNINQQNICSSNDYERFNQNPQKAGITDKITSYSFSSYNVEFINFHKQLHANPKPEKIY